MILLDTLREQMRMRLKGGIYHCTRIEFTYNSMESKTLEDIVEFHYRFERIHPFRDGNGRVGRLLMFKECLACGIVQFIIDDDFKSFYYRGLREWESVRDCLMDTCLAAQDNYKAVMDYFRVDA